MLEREENIELNRTHVHNHDGFIILSSKTLIFMYIATTTSTTYRFLQQKSNQESIICQFSVVPLCETFREIMFLLKTICFVPG